MLPILLTFWPFMETVIKKNKKYLGNCAVDVEEKVQRNILSSLNAVGTIILIIIYLNTQNNLIFTATILYPVIFYIYDTYYLWFNSNKKNNSFTYIIHHLTAIYLIQCIYLYNGNLRTTILIVLLCIELSNLPLYYVYHFLKTNNEKNIKFYERLLLLKKLQLGIYGFLRIVISGIFFNKYFDYIKHMPIFTSSFVLIFCMSSIWIYHQFNGYFKTKKEYNDFLIKNLT